MRNKRLALAVITAIGLMISPGAFAYQESPVNDGGAITGKVSFKGKVPEPQHFLVQKTPDVCGKQRDFPFVRVNETALQNVVIVLEGVEKGKPFPRSSAEFVAKDCTFLPYVTAVPKKGANGWPVFKTVNEDATMHNPHAYEVTGSVRRTLWNVGLPEKGSKFEKETIVRKGNVIKLECDQHDFMHSWTRVVENPYFAVVGEDGSFRIDEVPPGQYKLVAWHPLLGEQRQDVNVPAKAFTTAEFTFTGK